MIAATHPWWPHLFDWPRFLDVVSWLWLAAKPYGFTSSIGIGWAAVLGAWWLHHRCDTPRCFRKARYKTADGHHTLCYVCHPDFPNRRLSRAEILDRHHAHRRRCPDREPLTHTTDGGDW